MPERDIFSPPGPFRLPEWARQGAAAFPQTPSGGGAPLPLLPPQAATPITDPSPAGRSNRPPTFGDAIAAIGGFGFPKEWAPMLDSPEFNKPLLSAEKSANLPLGFADAFAASGGK